MSKTILSAANYKTPNMNVDKGQRLHLTQPEHHAAGMLNDTGWTRPYDNKCPSEWVILLNPYYARFPAITRQSRESFVSERGAPAFHTNPPLLYPAPCFLVPASGSINAPPQQPIIFPIQLRRRALPKLRWRLRFPLTRLSMRGSLPRRPGNPQQLIMGTGGFLMLQNAREGYLYTAEPPTHSNTTSNGYRYNLQQVIQAPPIADFIGSQDSGTMPDPDNEVRFLGYQWSLEECYNPFERTPLQGHSDAEIATIDGYLLPDLSQNPNIVFLFAGTNDINNNDDIDNAPARLMAVVDNITTTLPKTTVLVGTIPLNGDATKEQWDTQRWPKLDSVRCGKRLNGASVSLVPAGGNREWRRSRFQRQSLKQILKIKLSEEAQSECTCQFTEPNVPAQVTGLPPSGKCSDSNDNSTAVWFAGAIHYFSAQAILSLQKDLNGDGRGINAGHVGWLPSGVISLGVRAPRHQVQFSDLNGDGRAEYLWIHDDSFVDTWLNSGGLDNVTNAAKVVLQPEGQIASGIGKDGAGVRFADLNGDGHAEYQWIDNNGAMTDYLNLAATDCGAHVGWLPQGIVATGPVNGATRNNIILADVNGDGRADYLITHTSGVVELWLNGGGPDNGPINAAKVVWDPQGVIATGVGTSVTGVQFADLNGDGRAEYLDVNYITSAVNASLNGCA
ncbi:hypothetical protein B0H14DRAFT_2585523 [Mycena olivaceomarginata]|nr:hypothetical protein B0H14DRAFT_2585523 [Mycena olivaceomarginata]